MPAPVKPPILEVKNLSVSFMTRDFELRVIEDLSLTIAPGESYGIVGESGCGKSTLAYSIMGYLGRSGVIRSGSISLEGKEVTRLKGEELRRLRGAKIAMVYQEPMSALNPSLTIGRQLKEILIYHQQASNSVAYERAVQVLRSVKIPDPETMMLRYPHQISGGQQQRVVIAMAFLAKPSLLLLDEPTTALDVTVQAAVIEMLGELSRENGTSLVYISHNLGLIRHVCKRVGVMYAGQLVEEGTIDDVFNHPRHPYTQKLFECLPRLDASRHVHPLLPIRGEVMRLQERGAGCHFAPRCDHARQGLCETGVIAMQRLSEGNSHAVRCLRWHEIEHASMVADVLPPTSSLHDRAILQVDGLNKTYTQNSNMMSGLLSGNSTTAVPANANVSFDARRGETVAIVGESGCGKTTLAKIVTGLETASGGKVLFNGSDIAAIPVGRRGKELLLSLQMIFQNPDSTLNPSHSVGWALGRAVRKLRGIGNRVHVSRSVDELLRIVQLSCDFAGRKPQRLSGGQKQRVAIARAFAGNPAMVIADEPVSSLDVSIQAAIVKLLGEIQSRHDTALLFITHDLALVRYIADHVVVMYLGQIMESGPTDKIFQPPYHPYTEALLSSVPIADLGVTKRKLLLEGETPSAANIPKGCPFATRCPAKLGSICEDIPPPVIENGPDHRIRCHIPLQELARATPVFTRRSAVDTEEAKA
jgi:peptide/nickel transport system ATP-binding protein